MHKVDQYYSIKGTMDIEDLEAIFWSLLCCTRSRMETQKSMDNIPKDAVTRGPGRYPNDNGYIRRGKDQAQRRHRWWKLKWFLHVWKKLKNRIRKQLNRIHQCKDHEIEYDAEIVKAAGKLHFD